MISEMKAMAEENRHLKRMYAEMSMQNDLLKEALGKNVKAVHCPAGRVYMPERRISVSIPLAGR